MKRQHEVEAAASASAAAAAQVPKLDPELAASSVVDELRSDEPERVRLALERLVASVEDGFEAVRHWREAGGRTEDLLRWPALVTGGLKAPAWALLCQAWEAVSLYAASAEPALASALASEVLSRHALPVLRLLSPSNTGSQSRSVLRLLSAWLAASASTAQSVLQRLDFEQPHWEALLKRRARTPATSEATVDVRTAFLHFLLAALVSGQARLILDKFPKWGQMFFGLARDASSTVRLCLSGLRDRVVLDPALSKSLKMKLFSVYHLQPILGLFHWQGPYVESERPDAWADELADVQAATADLLSALVASTKTGVVFHDPTGGTSGRNQNPLLFNLLQSLQEPWAQPHYSRLIVTALATSPDQWRPFLTTLEKFWRPRPFSAAWLQIMDLIQAVGLALDYPAWIRKASLVPADQWLNLLWPENLSREVSTAAFELAETDRQVTQRGAQLALALARKCQALNMNFKPNELLSRLPNDDHLRAAFKTELEYCSAQADCDLDHMSNLVGLTTMRCDLDPSLKGSLMVSEMMAGLQTLPQTSNLRLALIRSAPLGEDLNGIKCLLELYFDPGCEQSPQVYDLLSARMKNLAYPYELLIWLHHLSGHDAPILEAVAQVISEARGVKFLTTSILGSTTLVGKSGKPWRMKECTSIVQILSSVSDLKESQEFLQAIPDKYKSKARSSSIGGIQSAQSKFSSVILQIEMHLANSQDWTRDQTIEQIMHLLRNVKDSELASRGSRLILSKPFVQASFQVSSESTRLVQIQELMELARETGDISRAYFDQFMTSIQDALESSRVEIADIDAVRQILNSLKDADYLRDQLARLVLHLLQGCKGRLVNIELIQTLMAKAVDIRVILIPAELESAKRSITRFVQSLLDVVAKESEWESLLTTWSQLVALNPILLHSYDGDIDSKILRKQSFIQPPPSFIEFVLDLMHWRPQFKSSLVGFVTNHLDDFFPDQSDVGVTLLSAIFSQDPEAMKAKPRAKLLKQSLPHLCPIFKQYLRSKTTTSQAIGELLALVLKSGGLEGSQLQALLPKTKPKEEPSSTEIHVLKARLICGQAAPDQTIFLMRCVLLPLMGSLRESFKAQDYDQVRSAFIVLQPLVEDAVLAKMIKSKDETLSHQLIRMLLKNGLKSVVPADIKAKCLKNLTLYTRLGFAEDDAEAAGMIHQLLRGHSDFLTVLLNEKHPHSEAKFHLLNLWSLVLERGQNLLVVVKDLPLLLSAYHGSLSEADQIILGLLHGFETEGKASLAEFHPLMWGPAAIGRYLTDLGGQKSVDSLIKRPKVSEILGAIDPAKMINSAIRLDPNMPFQATKVAKDLFPASPGLYDPRFFLQLICQLCSPSEFVDRHLKIMEAGGLAITFAALSSKDVLFRQVGMVALSRIYHQLQLAKLKAEKQIWLHLVNLVRNGVREANADPSKGATLRLPALTTAFLIRASVILHNPLDPLYSSITRFLLAKPVLALFNIPEFQRFFHSTALNHGDERAFILGVIRDGLKTNLDYEVAQKDYLNKIMLTFHAAPWPLATSGESKSLIRQILKQMMSIEEAAFDLFKNIQLSGWMLGEMTRSPQEGELISDCLEVALQGWQCIQRAMSVEMRTESTWLRLVAMDLETMCNLCCHRRLNGKGATSLVDLICSLSAFHQPGYTRVVNLSDLAALKKYLRSLNPTHASIVASKVTQMEKAFFLSGNC